MGNEIDHLNDLLKASGNDDVFKAEQDDNNNNDDGEGDIPKEYDPEYMKKHMKKYMKENPQSAEDLGFLKKAVTEPLNHLDGVEEADAVLVDGTEVLKAVGDSLCKMADMIGCLSGKVDAMESGQNFALQKAIGGAVVKVSETVDKIASAPNLQKGLNFASQHNKDNSLIKADGKVIKNALMKAVSSGNDRALTIMTNFESSGGNIQRLQQNDVAFINNLLEDK